MFWAPLPLLWRLLLELGRLLLTLASASLWCVLVIALSSSVVVVCEFLSILFTASVMKAIIS
jgi:hypothetical protein